MIDASSTTANANQRQRYGAGLGSVAVGGMARSGSMDMGAVSTICMTYVNQPID